MLVVSCENNYVIKTSNQSNHCTVNTFEGSKVALAYLPKYESIGDNKIVCGLFQIWWAVNL